MASAAKTAKFEMARVANFHCYNLGIKATPPESIDTFTNIHDSILRRLDMHFLTQAVLFIITWVYSNMTMIFLPEVFNKISGKILFFITFLGPLGYCPLVLLVIVKMP